MLIAVDIGNTRIKLGIFQQPSPPGLPKPDRLLEINPDEEHDWSKILPWLQAPPATLEWCIASVNRDGLARFQQWYQSATQTKRQQSSPLRQLTYQDLSLTIQPEHPERIGIDRLLGAVGANSLRPTNVGAVTIHLGTALTVNLINEQGVFCGGAILPGIGMSARALHEFTDQLPLIPMQELHDAPPPVGTATIAAMRAGLYWGAVGAMRELLAQYTQLLKHPPEVYLTGGAAPSVAAQLAPRAQHVPHLILGAMAKLCHSH